MVINDWAAHWGINPVAIADLERRLSGEPFEQWEGKTGDNETSATAFVQIEASHAGIRLWRNNSGAAFDRNGRLIRYGLGNISKAVNKRLKSADLVGIRPVVIEPRHVGATFGRFIAREMKAPGWEWRGVSATDREKAQRRWLGLVNGMGGDGCFATGPGTL